MLMPQNRANIFFARAHEYLTYAYFFILPLPDKFLTVALGLWCGSWLFWRVSHYRERYPLSKSSKIGLLLFVLYNLLNYTSALWGHSPELAGRLMEHRLSMWILSVILLFGFPPFLRFRNIVKSFIIGNLTMLTIFSIRLIILFLTDGETKYQLHTVGFHDYFDGLKHPAYFSLNLVLSFFLYLSLQKSHPKRNILPLICLYVTYGVMIFISGSRAGLLSFALLSLGVITYYARQRFSVKQIIVFVIPLLLVFGAGMLSTYKFHMMFDDSEHVSVRAPRKILWKTGAEMIIAKPILGYGLGSSKINFVERSYDNGLYLAFDKEYNVHNQYLETALESGLLSLGLLVLALCFFARAVERKRRVVAFVLLLIFGFALIFESMLLRIAAVSTFLGIILMLFSLSNNKHNIMNEEHSVLRAPIYLSSLLLVFILSLFITSQHLTFDPLNPQTYASKDYIEVSNKSLPLPLPEELSQLEVNAAKFDSKAQASLWSGNAYLLNKVTAKKLSQDEVLKFSTYCYVSDDFDGSWVKISIDNTRGKPSLVQQYYDLKMKGRWQKLEVKVEDETGLMPAHFFFARHNCNSLEELQGYVLFAYPQYIITKK